MKSQRAATYTDDGTTKLEDLEVVQRVLCPSRRHAATNTISTTRTRRPTTLADRRTRHDNANDERRARSHRLDNRRDALPAADAGRRETASLPRRRSSSRSVSSRRVPVMPSGWPSAIAPPLTLTRSRSSPSSFSTARYCAANASLTSIRSISSSVRPVRSSTLRVGGRRSHAHERGIDADRRPVDETADRSQAVAIDGLARRENQRGAAIDDPAGVAGRHAAVLLERRRQLREHLQRRLRAQVIVAATISTPLRVLISTGTTSSASRPSVQARSASCWLRSAYPSCSCRGDAVLAGAVLGGDRHRAAAVRVEQRLPQRVLELALSELEAAAQSADDVRRLAHALDAAGRAPPPPRRAESAARRSPRPGCPSRTGG